MAYEEAITPTYICMYIYLSGLYVLTCKFILIIIDFKTSERYISKC